MSVNCDQLSSRHQATGPRPWTAAGHNSPTKGCRVTAVTGSWLFKKIYMIKKTKKKKEVINLWVSVWQTGSRLPACEQWLLHLAKRNKKISCNISQPAQPAAKDSVGMWPTEGSSNHLPSSLPFLRLHVRGESRTRARDMHSIKENQKKTFSGSLQL